MSIQSIKIQNFQSHKNTFIEFSSGVNIICGENDSGKSAIFRAINFVVNNRPSGNDIRSNWEGDTVVAIDIDNKLVSRIKTDTENLYTLSGEKEPFKAFGKRVPVLIAKHLNINSVNFSRQLDGPFLLNKSASDVAKYYNEIVHLEIIDKTIANIAGTLRKERAALETEKETEKEKTEKLKEYDWLPDAEKEVVKLESLQQNINDIKNDQSVLQGLTVELKELKNADQELEKITKFENSLLTLMEQDEEIDNLQNDYDNLNSLIDRLESLIRTKEKLNQVVEFESQVNSLIEQSNQNNEDRKSEDELAKYIDLLKGYQEAEKRCDNIIIYASVTKALLVLDREIEEDVKIFNQLQGLCQKQFGLNKEHKKIGDKLKNLEIEFSESMPDICPIFSVECEYIKETKL